MLRGNAYPGRGIVIGRDAGGRSDIVAYFIMGRSENSRNRVFLETDDGIRTAAWRPELLSDPGLVIYHPVRYMPDGRAIVTNGDQTDTARDALAGGGSLRDALLTRLFEPDPPIYTPRISGLLEPGGSYCLSIIKSAYGDPECALRQFFEYSAPVKGLGHFIHTYERDGDPPPSFSGEPRPVAIDISGGLGAFAEGLWDALHGENKVALYAREIKDGVPGDSVIINRHGGSV
jgi:IMP cyclohydrolase